MWIEENIIIRDYFTFIMETVVEDRKSLSGILSNFKNTTTTHGVPHVAKAKGKWLCQLVDWLDQFTSKIICIITNIAISWSWWNFDFVEYHFWPKQNDIMIYTNAAFYVISLVWMSNFQNWDASLSHSFVYPGRLQFYQNKHKLLICLA